MAIMSDEHRRKVKETFDAQLKGKVEVLLFHEEAEPGSEQYTAASREIMTELAALSDGRIALREVRVSEGHEEAERYGIEQVPSLIMLDEQGRDQNLRFYGAPVGYEFMALLDDLVDVSRGETRLSEGARQQIRAIEHDLVIQVFSTPT